MLARLAPPLELPHVWRVRDLAAEGDCLASGHAALDAHLPGGGWPVGSMVEVLQAQAGRHAWRLLLPGLAAATAQKAGPVVLVAAPFEPFGPSLAAQGLPAGRLLCVRTDKPMARLWAAEQSLRCADVVAVLAWLPQARNEELRRLHMAAQQNGKLLFVFRGLRSKNDASPARLRLMVEGGIGEHADAMQVHILKRRGPPVDAPVLLPAHSQRLSDLLEARRKKGASAPSPLSPTTQHNRRSHVLDRTVPSV